MKLIAASLPTSLIKNNHSSDALFSILIKKSHYLRDAHIFARAQKLQSFCRLSWVKLCKNIFFSWIKIVLLDERRFLIWKSSTGLEWGAWGRESIRTGLSSIKKINFLSENWAIFGVRQTFLWDQTFGLLDVDWEDNGARLARLIGRWGTKVCHPLLRSSRAYFKSNIFCYALLTSSTLEIKASTRPSSSLWRRLRLFSIQKCSGVPSPWCLLLG